jgi:hypothetical protein
MEAGHAEVLEATLTRGVPRLRALLHLMLEKISTDPKRWGKDGCL